MQHNIDLNGYWIVDFLSSDPYISEEEPSLLSDSDSITQCPVPGYWEDMDTLFRTTALFSKMQCNPDYVLQQYPMTGYAPDMVLPNLLGCLMYQKTIILTTDCRTEADLVIGGAQNTVSAWINGRYLGRHEGYSTPFAFSVPADCLQHGENRITLAVSNHRLAGYMERPVSGVTSRAACSCTGGIYGNVELRFLPAKLRDFWVSTAEDCTSFTVHTNGAEHLVKKVEIYDSDVCICATEILPGQNCCTINAADYKLWSPSSPKLYTVRIAAGQQTLSQRFGIRRLTVNGTKLYLNGEPYFFRGTC